jgi:hypothetical protein
MKYRYLIFTLVLALVTPFAFAEIRTPAEIFSSAYGRMTGSCIRKQIATTGHNRLDSALTAGNMYMISCDDNSGAGVACACTQGGSSVSVSKTTAFVLQAGHEYPMYVDANGTQLSCQSYSGTPYVSACLLKP